MTRKQIKKFETKEVTQTLVYCDICEKKISPTIYRHKRCLGCQKDLCDSHTIWLEYEPFNDHHYGDYPEVVCQNCKNQLELFKDRISKVREQYEVAIEELEAEWKKNCLKNSVE